MNYAEVFIPMIGWGLGLFFLAIGASIASAVLLGFAVYNDAKAKMNDNAVMWAVLVGLFFTIPGIIYLCVRNEPLKRIYVCHNCGWGNPLSARQCARCGAGLYYPTEETAVRQKKAKTMLIWGLVLFGVSVAALIIMFAVLFGSLFSALEQIPGGLY